MALGYAHPDFLLSELSVSQIDDWKAFDRLCPIDHQLRLELCLAAFQTQIANLAKAIHSKSKSQSKIEDFLPRWDSGINDSKSNNQKIKEALLLFAEQHNKAIERREKRKKVKNGNHC